MSRREEISKNLYLVQERIARTCEKSGRIPTEVTLIAVTKNFPTEDAQILHDLGVRDFGENRDQEGALKSELLPADITWHFQGQIQSKKITSISKWADCIHSLHSMDHARKFDSLRDGKVRNIFIQVNFEPERSDRGGLSRSQLALFLGELYEMTQIRPVGLMTVAPLGWDASQIFKELRTLQMELFASFPSLVSLSMGMSGDFEEAITAGATHIRIGSSILGSRGVPV